MRLHLKNTHYLALRNVVKQAMDQSGIPDYVEIDQHEAWGLLKEMWDMKDNDKYRERLIIEVAQGEDPRFHVYSGNGVDIGKAEKLINRWVKNEFKVIYKHKERDNKASTPSNTVFQQAEVEIRVVVQPVKVPTTPETKETTTS